MQQRYRTGRVLKNTELLKGIFSLSVIGDWEVKPGQFFMLRGWGKEPLLPRPVSVHDFKDRELTFLYEVRGEGTELLSRLQEGEGIELLGPLGNGFDIRKVRGKVAVITGGIGVAPMKYLIKSLEGCEIDLYAGFKNDVYGIDEIRSKLENVFITTESGREGHKGYVTELFSPLEYNAVFCCGPEVMMKRVAEICKATGTPVYLSMESHMACGIGACLVCTCKTKDGNKRVCKDGPVFSGGDVIIGA